MADEDVPTDGATFREDNGRFVMTTSDGSEHELRDKTAYEAAVAAQSYGTRELAPEYFKL